MSNQNQSKNLFISHLKFNPTNDLTFNKPRVNKSGGKTMFAFVLGCRLSNALLSTSTHFAQPNICPNSDLLLKNHC